MSFLSETRLELLYSLISGLSYEISEEIVICSLKHVSDDGIEGWIREDLGMFVKITLIVKNNTQTIRYIMFLDLNDICRQKKHKADVFFANKSISRVKNS